MEQHNNQPAINTENQQQQIMMKHNNNKFTNWLSMILKLKLKSNKTPWWMVDR